MSTSTVTPDQSQAAPSSTLAAAVSAPSEITLPPQTSSNSDGSQLPQAPQPTSRLKSVLSAVANVVTTGLASVPAHGRPSFVNGLTEGARGAQAAEAQQQDIKFKTFDDQLRAASLHNQDIELQNHTQAQSDAHQAAQDAQHDWDEAHGIQYDEIPNSGQAVMDHLTAQTAASGSASIPAGTHLSADGKSILVPKQTDETQAAQLLKYNTFREAYNLPALPQGATFVPGKYLDMLQNRIEGHSLSGDVYNHDTLPVAIADLQSTRDSLAGKSGTNAAVLTQVDGTIKSMQAKLDYLDTHAAAIKQQSKQADLNAENSPETIAGAANKAAAVAKAQQPFKEALQDNAAANKPQKPQSTEWVPGVSADEKKKAELAENMTFNANNIASTLMRRPDLVGAVAGRFTSIQQMAGSNDPDIVALSTDIHNIAMANNGIHGMRSAEAVTTFENKLLNNFKNGPQGIYGGLKASTDSVQTFIDNARPETYKTHSKQGGAVRAMVPQGQQ